MPKINLMEYILIKNKYRSPLFPSSIINTASSPLQPLLHLHYKEKNNILINNKYNIY